MKTLPKDAFFAACPVALTYADVRLRTGHCKVLPDDVAVASQFSTGLSLPTPIVSSPMDTVTEFRMAIEMAKEGGLGIIHRNLSPSDQVAQVAKVKHYFHGMVTKPICFSPLTTMSEIENARIDKGYRFHSFPIIDSAGKLVGVLTGHDFEFCDDFSVRVEEVMSRDPVTAPQGTTVDQAYVLMKHYKRKVLPVVDANGIVVGLYTHPDAQRIVSGRSKANNVDSNGQLRVGAAIGVGPGAVQEVEQLLKENVDVVVLDSSHADSIPVITTLRDIKAAYPDLQVVVGNISEPESVKNLAEAGADGIKVGQGPGSICTTRIIAGVGCPQVTAVYECAREAAAYGIPVCADGGIQYSGDIPVALGAGASCVMLGSVLAGTDEAPGDTVFVEERQWKVYRGMGSLEAMAARSSSRQRYGQSSSGKSQLVPEGVESRVPYTGRLQDVVYQLVGGLRRGMGYVGAATIQELQEKANFRRLSPAGQRESRPHDIIITKAAPNYRGDSDDNV